MPTPNLKRDDLLPFHRSGKLPNASLSSELTDGIWHLDEQIATYKSQVKQIYATITDLEQTKLLAVACLAPIRRLPQEILTEIVVVYDRLHSERERIAAAGKALRICGVPQLWSCINMRYLSSITRREFFELLLVRSLGGPLHVTFDSGFSIWGNSPPTGSVQLLISQIASLAALLSDMRLPSGGRIRFLGRPSVVTETAFELPTNLKKFSFSPSYTMDSILESVGSLPALESWTIGSLWRNRIEPGEDTALISLLQRSPLLTTSLVNLCLFTSDMPRLFFESFCKLLPSVAFFEIYVSKKHPAKVVLESFIPRQTEDGHGQVTPTFILRNAGFQDRSTVKRIASLRRGTLKVVEIYYRIESEGLQVDEYFLSPRDDDLTDSDGGYSPQLLWQ
ncbi:hypothetical protein DL96DRAFT_1600452 [Flagelloscypha sp. PMI_526]|nr:hypothetical protein DL96DRAFT_1600452 [Flagelloscypha sp. PMI_526]